MPLPFIAQLLIGVALNIIGYLLIPKPKPEPPPAVEDLENPTVEAGRPIPVVFGSGTVSGLNVIWYGDKSIRTRKVKVEKK